MSVQEPSSPRTGAILALGTVHQLNVSPGGVPKTAVDEAEVGALGLAGDAHRGLQHGGPERAVCFFTLEMIERLRSEGHPIVPGDVGENVTMSGIDLARVEPGQTLEIGDTVVVEVTRYTTPCVNITAAFKDGDFTRIAQKLHPGESRFYAKVLRAGVIRRGDVVRLKESGYA